MPLYKVNAVNKCYVGGGLNEGLNGGKIGKIEKCYPGMNQACSVR